jgi:hypothetical protein
MQPGDLIRLKPDEFKLEQHSNLIIAEFGREYTTGKFVRVFRLLGPSKGGPLIFWTQEADWIKKYFDVISPGSL